LGEKPIASELGKRGPKPVLDIRISQIQNSPEEALDREDCPRRSPNGTFTEDR
jgi:hypothetical protein